MRFKEYYLFKEVTSDEKFEKQYKGKLDRTSFDKAVQLDPTSKGSDKVGQYTDWIIKNKLYTLDDEKTNELTNNLNNYNRYKHKLEIKDRNILSLNYDNFNDVIKKLSQENLPLSKSEQKSKEKEKAEKEADVVFNTPNYIIISPKTEYASQFFGAGADWCTARRESDMCRFKQYNDKGAIYIIKDKRTKEKYQLFITTNGKRFEFRDAKNDAISRDLFTDKEIKDWLNDKLANARDGKLTEEDMKDFAIEIVNDLKISKENKDEAYQLILQTITDFERGNDYFDYDLASSWASDVANQTFDLFQILQDLGINVDPNSDKNKMLMLTDVYPHIPDMADDEEWMEIMKDKFELIKDK